MSGVISVLYFSPPPKRPKPLVIESIRSARAGAADRVSAATAASMTDGRKETAKIGIEASLAATSRDMRRAPGRPLNLIRQPPPLAGPIEPASSRRGDGLTKGKKGLSSGEIMARVAAPEF